MHDVIGTHENNLTSVTQEHFKKKIYTMYTLHLIKNDNKHKTLFSVCIICFLPFAAYSSSKLNIGTTFNCPPFIITVEFFRTKISH